MSGTSAFTGDTVLRFMDQMSLFMLRLGRLLVFWIVWGFVCCGIFVIFRFASTEDLADISNDPSYALTRALHLSSGFFSYYIFFMVIFHIFSICSMAWRWSRLSEAGKRIHYEIDTEKFVAITSTGIGVTVPWSNVKTSKKTDNYLILRLKPGGYRVIPLRAFADTDITRLVEYAGNQTSPA